MNDGPQEWKGVRKDSPVSADMAYSQRIARVVGWVKSVDEYFSEYVVRNTGNRGSNTVSMGTELEQLVDEFSARKLASGDGCVDSVHIQVDKRQLFQGVVHRYEGHELHCFASKY